MPKKVKHQNKANHFDDSLVPVYQTVPPTQNKDTESESIIELTSFHCKRGQEFNSEK